MSPSLACPLSASCNVARVRMSVDLQAPFGPSNPNIPRGMSRETFCKAWVPFGYRLERFSIRRSIVVDLVFRSIGVQGPGLSPGIDYGFRRLQVPLTVPATL